MDGKKELYHWEITIEDTNNLKLPSSTNDDRTRKCPSFSLYPIRVKALPTTKWNIADFLAWLQPKENNTFEAKLVIFAIGCGRFRMKLCIPVLKSCKTEAKCFYGCSLNDAGIWFCSSTTVTEEENQWALTLIVSHLSKGQIPTLLKVMAKRPSYHLFGSSFLDCNSIIWKNI